MNVDVLYFLPRNANIAKSKFYLFLYSFDNTLNGDVESRMVITQVTFAMLFKIVKFECVVNF